MIFDPLREVIDFVMYDHEGLPLCHSIRYLFTCEEGFARHLPAKGRLVGSTHGATIGDGTLFCYSLEPAAGYE